MVSIVASGSYVVESLCVGDKQAAIKVNVLMTLRCVCTLLGYFTARDFYINFLLNNVACFFV